MSEGSLQTYMPSFMDSFTWNVEKCVRDVTIKVNSYPLSAYLLQSGQSYLEALFDQDRSAEEFELEFRGKRANLREQMFMGWRPHLEAALVKKLPENLAPANIESPDFFLRAHVDSKNPRILSNRLSLDLRKLLRADIRFMCHGRAVNYPEGFDTSTLNKSSSTFDPVSSAIAKALLGPLQRPDASYIEMQALGASFVCGRCSREPTYYAWYDIVEHYLREYAWWKKACTRNARFSQGGEGITLVFTHDIHKIDHIKPLVNLVTKRESRPNIHRRAPTSNCKLCSSIGHYYGAEAAYITRHLQEVVLSIVIWSLLAIGLIPWQAFGGISRAGRALYRVGQLMVILFFSDDILVIGLVKQS